MRDVLQRFLSREYPEFESVEIQEFAPIPGGYSRETYRFDAVFTRGGASESRPCILRKDPPPAAEILSTSRQSEHDLLLRVAEHTNIPVPKSYCVANDHGIFGQRAMVIERASGSNMVSHLFNGGPCCDQAESIATHLCELIAELHLTDPKRLNPTGSHDDPRGVGADPSSWDNYMDSMIRYYINGYPNIAYSPLPAFYDGYLSLRREKPRALPLVLVHGDFNPANFLYDNGRVTALIDWENSHMGDPREDLGWMSVMDNLSATNIMGSVTKEGGFIPYYNKLTGFNVTAEEVAYFMKFTGANIGVPVLSSVKRRLDGEHEEIIAMYIFQPATASTMLFATLLGYPMPSPEGA
jgi:aminoglycoside phosphotransferase (APT) family kinase protein